MAHQLFIGNKNYSSWSMRPWVLMRALDIPFDEVQLRFNSDDVTNFHESVAQRSPAGRVPILCLDDGFAVWDSLAITETLHELFPGVGVWPSVMPARARARSLCAEMHAGFHALRQYCPMNVEAQLPEVGARLWAEQAGLRTDLARIEAMWAEALRDSGGPFLFGRFGAVDAFYAPVCMRLRTYSLPLSEASRAYISRVCEVPAVRQWIDDALVEHHWVGEDEPYREPPRSLPSLPPGGGHPDPSGSRAGPDHA